MLAGDGIAATRQSARLRCSGSQSVEQGIVGSADGFSQLDLLWATTTFAIFGRARQHTSQRDQLFPVHGVTLPEESGPLFIGPLSNFSLVDVRIDGNAGYAQFEKLRTHPAVEAVDPLRLE